MKTLLIILIYIFLFSSCAPIPKAYEPIIDTDWNFDKAKYWQDLHDCRIYAKQISPANSAALKTILS